MPNKKNINTLPANAQIIKFSDKEIKPMFISAAKIHKFVMGVSAKTWANWRTQKIGPKYFVWNGRVYYRVADIEEVLTQNPVKTFSNN
jgi:hypothetical protein